MSRNVGYSKLWVRNLKRLISSTHGLRPLTTINLSTGEVLSPDQADQAIITLIHYVQREARRLYEENGEQIHQEVRESGRIVSPHSWGRSHYCSSVKSLSREVRAKSRINELVLHKLVSTVLSYERNPNPRKNFPGYSPKIELGAIDKQMCSLSYDPQSRHIFLEWKCWDQHLLIEFWLPPNFQTKNIKKWCLPTVTLEQGVPHYRFSVEENCEPTITTPTEIAGVDLGIVEPFTLVVLNKRGKLSAKYRSTRGLQKSFEKRSRLLAQKNHVHQKLLSYEALGLDGTVLIREKNRLGEKIARLGSAQAGIVGHEIAHKLKKHALNTVVLENLSWVHGTRYGSKWNHSAQQASITHSLQRNGIRTKKVSPKNTSQDCSRCGAKITHNPRQRTIHCSDCSLILDRDYNAAINITKRCPDYTSMLGDNYSPLGQVMGSPNHTNITLRTPT